MNRRILTYALAAIAVAYCLLAVALAVTGCAGLARLHVVAQLMWRLASAISAATNAVLLHRLYAPKKKSRIGQM